MANVASLLEARRKRQAKAEATLPRPPVGHSIQSGVGTVTGIFATADDSVVFVVSADEAFAIADAWYRAARAAKEAERG